MITLLPLLILNPCHIILEETALPALIFRRLNRQHVHFFFPYIFCVMTDENRRLVHEFWQKKKKKNNNLYTKRKLWKMMSSLCFYKTVYVILKNPQKFHTNPQRDRRKWFFMSPFNFPPLFFSSVSTRLSFFI